MLGEYFNQDLLSIAWSDLNPSPSEFTFDWLDRLLKYATEHRMATLSTLIWSGGTPQWLKAGNFTKAQLMTIAEKYVTTVMTHYKGRINAWQVVNEPIWQAQGFWQASFGSDFSSFVRQAYHWARAADPEATLLITDYANEGRDLPTMHGFFQLVEDLLARGTPIDAVGIEGHLLCRLKSSRPDQND